MKNKGALWNYSRRWEDNIKMDFKDSVWGCGLVSCGSG